MINKLIIQHIKLNIKINIKINIMSWKDNKSQFAADIIASIKSSNSLIELTRIYMKYGHASKKKIHVFGDPILDGGSIIQAFEKYGTIEYGFPVGNRDYFVTMNNAKNAQAAFNALNGSVIDGNKIKLNYTDSKPTESDYNDMMQYAIEVIANVKLQEGLANIFANRTN